MGRQTEPQSKENSVSTIQLGEYIHAQKFVYDRGTVMAIAAGLLFGVSFDPVTHLEQSNCHNPQNGIEACFLQFCPIYRILPKDLITRFLISVEFCSRARPISSSIAL